MTGSRAECIVLRITQQARSTATEGSGSVREVERVMGIELTYVKRSTAAGENFPALRVIDG
jgi:hypothetical protein